MVNGTMNKLEILYNEIESIITNEVGESGRIFTFGKFEGIGWLDFHYKCSTYDGLYPRISLKQQTNAVHFYIILWIDGKPVLDDYIEIFGKSAVGKGCLRIKKLDETRRAALVEIIRHAKKANESGEEK